MRAAVQIGNAGLHVEHGRDCIQRVLARFLFIIHIDLGEIDLFIGTALNRSGAGMRGLHFVDAVGAGFDGYP